MANNFKLSKNLNINMNVINTNVNNPKDSKEIEMKQRLGIDIINVNKVEMRLRPLKYI